MSLEIMDIITLNDDKKFFVSNKTNVDGVEYYLLVNEDDGIMVGYVENDEFVSIQDEMKYSELIVKFDPNKVIGNKTEEDLKGLLNNTE